MGENITDAQAIAEAQSKPGTFNLIERLQGRNLPTEDIDIYLDERLAYDLLRLEEKHADAKKDEEAKAIEAKIAKVKKALQESRYVFTIVGLTNEQFEDLTKELDETHPEKFTEELNPLTSERVRTVQPNPERDRLWSTMYLAAIIEKVVDPDGNVDDDINRPKAGFLLDLLPLDGLRRINEAGAKMRLAVEWMDQVQDEDFSPTP